MRHKDFKRRQVLIGRLNKLYLLVWYLERELDFIGVVPTIFKDGCEVQ